MCDCNCKDQLRNKRCCGKCDLNKRANAVVCVTLSDVARWNAAAKAIADLDPQLIDLNDYVKKEDLDSLVQEYLDLLEYLKSIPEYYETEEEVLLLLNEYVRKADSYDKDSIDELLQGYVPLSYLSNYATVQALLNVGNISVTGVSFDDSTSNLIITKGNGSSSSIHLVTDGNGQGAVIANETIELSVYCNTLSTETPDTPINGGYDFLNYIKTLPVDPNTPPQYTWSFSTDGMTIDDTHTVWISKRRFNSKTSSEATWSTPIKYSAGNITTNNTYQTVTYDNSAVIVVYHKGTILRVPEYDSLNVEVNHHYRSIAPAKPVGGVYDFTTRTLTTFPHTQGNVSDLWLDYTTSEQWTDPESPQEDPTVIEYTWYFSLGLVQYNNGTTTITWSDPAVYGGDYCMAAYNMRFVAVDYSVLADNITLTTNELTTVAQHVTLSSLQLDVIALNVTLTASLLAIIADQVVVDANITQFRGEVLATEFTVVKDNAYYIEEDGNVIKHTDIDLKLFSVSLNIGQLYDPTSLATDVVLNIYNPGILEGHITGNETTGDGNKGTLTGNNIAYVLNPKRLSQSVTEQYSCLLQQNTSDDTPLEKTFPLHVVSTSHKAGVITLPDPKMYVGCTIEGSILPSVLVLNMTISSRDTLLDTVFNNSISVLYSAYYDAEHQHGAGNISFSLLCEEGLPRIDVVDCDYRFIQMNIAKPSDRRYVHSCDNAVEWHNSLICLNKDFYGNLKIGVANLAAQSTYNSFVDYTIPQYGTDTSNWNDNMDMMSNSDGMYILPSPIGLYKLYRNLSLSFTATAKRAVAKDIETPITGAAQFNAEIYYWDITTEDFNVCFENTYTNPLESFNRQRVLTCNLAEDVLMSQTSDTLYTYSYSEVQERNSNWNYVVDSVYKLLMIMVAGKEAWLVALNNTYLLDLINESVTS